MIETHPRLEDETPFPTLWWLTCKSLTGAVSNLESAGWMARLNERLLQDAEIQAALDRSTRRYQEARDALEAIDSQGHPGGGPDRVKCLHAHTAHHLVTGDNPVGRAVLAELSWKDPERPCV